MGEAYNWVVSICLKSCNMSFAKKHMYKQGWAEGKGLGRNESGMKTAIKVKIKRDQAGIGHDMAEEFTFQWWDHVFNRAASKIKLKGEEDSDSSDSDDDASGGSSGAHFDISNKKPTKKKYDPKQILYGRFVSGGLLVDENMRQIRERAERDAAAEGNDGSGDVVIVNSSVASPAANGVSSDSESDDDDDLEVEMKLYAVAGLPEEELLRRCGGRTAHKGARHGLKASAKLERIERQEGVVKQPTVPQLAVPQPVLQPADSKPADSESADSKVMSAPIVNSAETVKKEKKHKKRSAAAAAAASASGEADPPKKKKKKNREKPLEEAGAAVVTDAAPPVPASAEKKRKKKKEKNDENVKVANVLQDPFVTTGSVITPVEKKKKKKKKKTVKPPVIEENDNNNDKEIDAPKPTTDVVEGGVKKEKKIKKKKKRDCSS